MSNPWVEHVKKYAKDNNITYMCAITEASKTYKKTKSNPENDNKTTTESSRRRRCRYNF